MGFRKYAKRAAKYIIKDYRPLNVQVKTYQLSANDEFSNKTVFITGGGSGLGFYVAKRLIGSGARVIISGRKEDKLKSAVKKLGVTADYVVLDVQDMKNIVAAMDKLFEKYGFVDILINNAGISLHEKEFTNVSLDDFTKQIDTNLRGPYMISQVYVKKVLAMNREGQIIFISSERGSQCDVLPYGLTKVAINSLVEGLSLKYYRKGIRVNAVAPGVTATDMTGIDRAGNMEYEDSSSGRYFIPEEVAEVVAFVASERAKCISGEVIHTNAGNHLNGWWQ